MKIERRVVTGIIATAILAVCPAIGSPLPKPAGTPAQMIVTVRPSPAGGTATSLENSGLAIVEDKKPARILGMQRLTGDLANMQLFVYLDDSTRSSSLATHFPELKKYLQGLPATTQVAIGYMRNGGFDQTQSFTTDHQKAADALRLPQSLPGENGSPYFALSYLVDHWPSHQPTVRRAVLMLTDGVDRYYDSATIDDPYVDTAIRDALRNQVEVYSIYLRGAGLYGRGLWTTTVAQSRLIAVSEQSGGHAYFQDFSDPVEIAPFLRDLQEALANQYRVTFEASNAKGMHPVKLRTETPGLKVIGPTRIYVR